MARTETHTTPIPTQWIGPLTIHGNAINDTVRVPLATYESPLWPSTARGAKVAEHSGGVRCTIIDERMARSVLLVASDAATAFAALQASRAPRAEACPGGERLSRKLAHWQGIVIASAMQCGRATLPQVEAMRDFADILEDAPGLRWIFSPHDAPAASGQAAEAGAGRPADQDCGGVHPLTPTPA